MKCIIYIDVDESDVDSKQLLIKDIEQELNCCWHSFNYIDVHIIDDERGAE